MRVKPKYKSLLFWYGLVNVEGMTTQKTHMFKAVQYFDAIDLNAEILHNSKLL